MFLVFSKAVGIWYSRFDALLRGDSIPSQDELQQKLAVKAAELKEEADSESTHAIKNVLADLAATIAFVVVCILSREELRVLRGFFDEAVYGLSDSAKAFAIILFTDIFVGFHAPKAGLFCSTVLPTILDSPLVRISSCSLSPRSR